MTDLHNKPKTWKITIFCAVLNIILYCIVAGIVVPSIVWGQPLFLAFYVMMFVFQFNWVMLALIAIVQRRTEK